MKALCIGQEWRGSNASGLFYALSRQGCITNVINEQAYISTSASHLPLKALHRLIRSWQVTDLNGYMQEQASAFAPDWILVYKGAFMKAGTIQAWITSGIPVVAFYPDVSFTAHGPHIPKCIPYYSHIFTTKTFVADDLARQFGYPREQVSFVPHGFDPLVHRPLGTLPENLRCDVSFIGNYSPFKAMLLEELVRKLPDLDLKIWGGTWNRYQGSALNTFIQGQQLLGDAYVAAINASRINLGILSEQVRGASSGDLITSRTFHIPGSGGFLLHQRNNEALQYFREDEEAAFFDGPDELVEKVRYFLEYPDERARIAAMGHQRALREYSMDVRAKDVLAVLKVRGLIS
ncbi:MAG: glycosyltransferase [Saprospiraceae bacterium]